MNHEKIHLINELREAGESPTESSLMDRNTMGSKDEQMVQTSPGHM